MSLSTIAIQDTYPEDFAHCFGCGRNNSEGHGFKTIADGLATRTVHTADPTYRGAGDFAYGGLIASLIDCHSAASAAIFWMHDQGLAVGSETAPRFVTARLEVDYVAPTPLGELVVVGTAVEVHDRKVIVTSELTHQGVTTARGRAVLVRVT